LRFKYSCSLLLCVLSVFLFAQQADIYNNVSIVGTNSNYGKKITYKYIRHNNGYIAFRINKDSVSKMYNHDIEVVSIRKDLDTMKTINLKDKKLIVNFEKLERIKEKYTYYRKDSIFCLTNKKGSIKDCLIK